LEINQEESERNRTHQNQKTKEVRSELPNGKYFGNNSFEFDHLLA